VTTAAMLREQLVENPGMAKCHGCRLTCHQTREFCDACWKLLPAPMRCRILNSATPYQRTKGSWVSQEFREAVREAKAHLGAQIVGAEL
jgi:hypothetical protein